MHFPKLHLPEEPYTYISVPVEGITRQTVTNKCMPRVHSQIMATCKTKKAWNEERSMRKKERTVQYGWSALDARNGSTCTVQVSLQGSILDLSNWTLSATSVTLKALLHETL